MVLGQDSNFTPESFIKCYNSDLANDYGNLLNRVTGLIGKNHGGIMPVLGELTPAEIEIKKQGDALPVFVKGLIDNFKVQEAVVAAIEYVRVLNKYMEIQAPWKLAKTDIKAAERVLYAAAEGLKVATELLAPVMPTKTKIVLDILGKPGSTIKSHPALFPRIEVEKQ